MYGYILSESEWKSLEYKGQNLKKNKSDEELRFSQFLATCLSRDNRNTRILYISLTTAIYGIFPRHPFISSWWAQYTLQG